MARYIDAVICAEIISEKFDIPLVDLVDIFAEIPTADVVEVVMCKDCKHYKVSSLFPKKQIKFCYKALKNGGIAIGHGFKENDFCSYGERSDK